MYRKAYCIGSGSSSKDVAIITTIVFVIIMFVFLNTSVLVNATDSGVSIFPPGSKPYGQTYGQWSIKWFQWAFSIPKDKNPIIDDSGKNCAINQNDQYAWFLAGSGGGKIERVCTVPAGKAIFFPIMDTEASYAEFPDDKTEVDLRNTAHADQDTVSHLTLTIDGVSFQNLNSFRADSPLFNFTTPQNGMWDLHSAKSQAVADGYYVMLKPLPVGAHEIHWSGVLGSITSTSAQIQPEDVTYHLKVQ